MTLEPTQNPLLIHIGDISYKASNNWSITVFNDADEWDYIDNIVTGNGHRIDFDEIEKLYPNVAEYKPTKDVAWLRYRIPDKYSSPCPKCNSLFKRNMLNDHIAKCL